MIEALAREDYRRLLSLVRVPGLLLLTEQTSFHCSLTSNFDTRQQKYDSCERSSQKDAVLS